MSNGAKVFDGDIKKLLAGHDEQWTPDRAIHNINTGLLPILGRVSDVYIKAAQLTDNESLSAVFAALAQAYSSIIFTLGCVTGGNCGVCDEQFKEAGIRVVKGVDEMVRHANMIVRLKRKVLELQEIAAAENEDDDPDPEPPPEGTPVN